MSYHDNIVYHLRREDTSHFFIMQKKFERAA